MREALLDTDIISFHLKGFLPVTTKMEAHYQHFGYLNVSVVTYYEIMHGLLFKDAKKQMKAFESFVKDCRIVPLTTEIADVAAAIFADLRRGNQTIGHTDTLIGATALHHDLKVVTNNQNHFKRIPNLELDNWL
jgi:tRNA(fMet)-specific endonuclease VapC